MEWWVLALPFYDVVSLHWLRQVDLTRRRVIFRAPRDYTYHLGRGIPCVLVQLRTRQNQFPGGTLFKLPHKRGGCSV